MKLSDTRGPFTFEIYVDGATSAACITGPNFVSASGEQSADPISTPPDQLGVTTQHSMSKGGDAYTFVEGRAGADVTGATLNLSDGTQVQATVQNGWFVAWWPGSSDATSATLATSNAGTQTQTFPAPKRPPVGGTTTGPGAGTSFSSGSGSGPVSGYTFNSQFVK